jgi:hypothetical protein
MTDLLPAQRLVVLATSSAGLLAVSIPLGRALRLCLAARRATRVVPRAALERGTPDVASGGVEPFAVLMWRVLGKSLESDGAQGQPSELVLDATKQYTLGEYETHYARPISMYANLLPPIGLTGNAIGMLILLVCKEISDAPLELAALGLAMISTIFALIGYALLEAVKLRLYGRLLTSVTEVASCHSALDSRRRALAAAAAAVAARR